MVVARRAMRPGGQPGHTPPARVRDGRFLPPVSNGRIGQILRRRR